MKQIKKRINGQMTGNMVKKKDITIIIIRYWVNKWIQKKIINKRQGNR